MPHTAHNTAKRAPTRSKIASIRHRLPQYGPRGLPDVSRSLQEHPQDAPTCHIHGFSRICRP
eukprot:835271-Pyramimonas_sp.AAC.1